MLKNPVTPQKIGLFSPQRVSESFPQIPRGLPFSETQMIGAPRLPPNRRISSKQTKTGGGKIYIWNVVLSERGTVLQVLMPFLDLPRGFFEEGNLGGAPRSTAHVSALYSDPYQTRGGRGTFSREVGFRWGKKGQDAPGSAWRNGPSDVKYRPTPEL